MEVVLKSGLRYIPRYYYESYMSYLRFYEHHKASRYIKYIPSGKYKVIKKEITGDKVTFIKLIAVWIKYDGEELKVNAQDITEIIK